MRGEILKRLRHAVIPYSICALLCVSAMASDELIPMGEAVGIRVTVDGILVADLAEAADGTAASPAQKAGVKAGDIITALNGMPVDSAAELSEAVSELGEGEAELTVLRGGREIAMTVTPEEGPDGAPHLGLWLRDGITGIGTVTYLDPETGQFGALGHGVNGAETGTLLPVEGGSVCRARIVDITRGRAGAPGELAGSFALEDVVGQIRENTVSGIFGVMEGTAETLRPAVPVAEPEEVESGPATILACVSGHETGEYQVEISRAGFVLGDGRDLTVRVTDPALLELTGGIVQGMSGSPILQNGKLVGAVTHVLTSDPTRGFGILAANMRKAASAA